MKREVRFTGDAETDLLSISAYTASSFGADQEKRYRAGLKRALETLLAFPGMGSEQADIAEGLRRHVHAAHAIYYSEQPFGILVERILGPGQDPTREFED